MRTTLSHITKETEPTYKAQPPFDFDKKTNKQKTAVELDVTKVYNDDEHTHTHTHTDIHTQSYSFDEFRRKASELLCQKTKNRKK